MTEPTEQQLEQMAREHLRYECDMFSRAVGHLNQPDAPDNYVAWLEIYLLHARVLYDFLRSKPIKDDVVASHFAPEWNGSEDEDVGWLGKELPDVDKRLVHLTLSRLTAPTLGYRQELPKRLSDAWKRFIERLPAERRAWFET